MWWPERALAFQVIGAGITAEPIIHMGKTLKTSGKTMEKP